MAFLHDEPKGFLPFLDAGGDFVHSFIAEIWRDENFGKTEKAISRSRFSRRVGSRRARRNCLHASLLGCHTAVELANRCVDPSSKMESCRRSLAPCESRLEHNQNSNVNLTHVASRVPRLGAVCALLFAGFRNGEAGFAHMQGRTIDQTSRHCTR